MNVTIHSSHAKIKVKTAFIAFLLFISCGSFFSQTKGSDKNDSLFISAYKKFNEKEYKCSYIDYSSYLVKYPGDAVATYNRGLCAYEMEDYKDGITNFNRSVKLGRRETAN